MARLLNVAIPAGSDAPSTLDTGITDFKQAILDFFGIPDNTTVTNALGDVDATGLQYWKFNNQAASPTASGRLQQNAANLEFHDGTAARILYQQSGLDVAVADGGTGSSTAAGARTALGLDTMATQAASAVAITGGTVTGITDLAVADGGTGSSTAATARTALGLAIGTDVQAFDADLGAVAGLASNGMIARTGAGTASVRTITGTGQVTVTNGDGVAGNPTIAIGATDELTGLALSNNGTDATNDIDIAVGAAASADAAIADRVFMSLTAAITKRLDATWVVGTNQGGLDTGVVGNNTYHVFLIQRTDTGVEDVLFSLSATAPTMPANYTKQRRIGSLVRTAGAIKPFFQRGDDFVWTVAVLDVDDAAPGTTAVTRTLTAPTGISVKAMCNVFLAIGNGIADTALYISSLDADDVAASTTAAPLGSVSLGGGANDNSAVGAQVAVWTNTSAQVRTRQNVSTTMRIATLGWLDRRGRG